MSTNSLRGPDDVMLDIIRDLRGYSPLAAALEGTVSYSESYGDDYAGSDTTDRVFVGPPGRPQEHPIEVVVSPVYDGSTHLGAGVNRTYRVQVTIQASKKWQNAREWPILEMQQIQGHIADRMDRAATMPRHRPEGGESGTVLEPDDGERLMLTTDWRIGHTQAFQDEGNS